MTNDIKSFVYAVGQSCWVIFGLVGAGLLAYLLLGATPENTKSYFSTNDVGLVLFNAFVYSLAVMIVFIPILWKRQGHDVSELVGTVKRLTLSGFGAAIFGYVVYFIVSTLVSIAVSNVPGFNSDQTQDIGFKDLTHTYEYIAAFIGLVILPPIAEELLFRGYLFGRLRKRQGFFVSALVTSAVFGFVHFQWNVGIDVFVLSLVLCYLRERTGSIWAGMIVHGLKNGLAYFVLFIVPLIHSNLLQ